MMTDSTCAVAIGRQREGIVSLKNGISDVCYNKLL